MFTTDELIKKYKAEMQKMISNSKPPALAPKQEIKAPEQLQDFPSFTPEIGGLDMRIERILEENRDVALESDRPANLFSQSQQNSIQGDLILDGDDIISQSLNLPQDTPQALEIPESQPAESSENMQEMISRTCIRGGQKAQYSPPANTGLAQGINIGKTPPLTDTGTLRIETFTANRAIPIKGAVIRVKNEEENRLVAVFVSDSSGNTQSFTLPTPDRELSATPDSVHPFVNYLVDIRAEGFIPQTNLPVQMFGGTESFLPANLVPLNT